MNLDKKISYGITISALAVLLLALILPGSSGRIIAAILLLPLAAIGFYLIKRRNIPSIHKREVLLIMAVVGVLYVILHYITGISFGFYNNLDSIVFINFFEYLLPIIILIGAIEVYRYVIVAQNDKTSSILCYLSCIVADLVITNTIEQVTTFNRFMDLVGMTLLPSIIANFLYHYLTKRYGFLSVLIYRYIITLPFYLFSIVSAIPDSLIVFAKLLLPIAIFVFIRSMYEKKRRYALAKKNPLTVASVILSVVIMTGITMLVSNQFQYGALVIATESMTGEINVGDVVIFEQYDGQKIEEGQIIVFDNNGSKIVHRVVKIEVIDGVTRYHTKGDANEGNDAGYRTREDLVGLVNIKLSYVGYPTIWLHGLFNR